MIRSLGFKLAMLAVTMGVVFWIGWQPGEPQQVHSELSETVVVTTASSMAETPSPTSPARQAVGNPIADRSGASNPAGMGGLEIPRLVDLNSATANELESLPGIGAVLAQRVIDHRQSVGRFLAVEDLREVKGIGVKKFEQVKSLVTVAKGAQKGKMEKQPS